MRASATSLDFIWENVFDTRVNKLRNLDAELELASAIPAGIRFITFILIKHGSFNPCHVIGLTYSAFHVQPTSRSFS